MHSSGRRIAVVFLTSAGAEVAERLAAAWPADWGADLYSPKGSLSDLVRGLWASYDGFVFIMAVGIAVRVIAPLLQDKWSDPGVVVVDEKGNFAVSLVGGHWGMANDLARRVAAAIGAVPVVTTATDVQGRPAIDVLARECGFYPIPRERVKLVNKALLRGERVVVFTEWELPSVGGGDLLEFVPWEERRSSVADGAAVFVTSRVIDPLPDGALCLCPRSLVAGIGCKRGVSAAEVLDAVRFALRQAGRRREGLRGLASHLIKEDEVGLREAALALGVELEFFGTELLQSVAEKLPQIRRSDFVKSRLGVEGVCEPAAVAAARDGSLILSKTCVGRVTVALAEDGLLLSASGREIRRI
ncbi:MAG: cobalt-precorrin 5A hydrolase [Thermacetogeniaceae bacterium]